MDGRHQGVEGGCKGSFKQWYIGPVGTGRKKKQGVIYTGRIIECSCTCHKKGKAKRK